MARKALSLLKKRQILQEDHTLCMARAVTMYQQEKAKAGKGKLGL